MSKRTQGPWQGRIDNPITQIPLCQHDKRMPEHVIYGPQKDGKLRLVASIWGDDEEAKANFDFIMNAANDEHREHLSTAIRHIEQIINNYNEFSDLMMEKQEDYGLCELIDFADQFIRKLKEE